MARSLELVLEADMDKPRTDRGYVRHVYETSGNFEKDQMGLASQLYPKLLWRGKPIVLNTINN